MDLDSYTLRVTLLALPGLIWVMLDDAFRPPKERTQVEYIIHIFVFGVVTYFVAGIAYKIGGFKFDIIELGGSEKFNLISCYDEIFWSVFWSIILAHLWIAGRTHKLVHRLFNYLGISPHTGEPDIWGYVFTSSKPRIKYANIRLFSQELVYSGYVEAYSDQREFREIAIADVKVFNFDGILLYESPYIYFSCKNEDISVEFPVI